MPMAITPRDWSGQFVGMLSNQTHDLGHLVADRIFLSDPARPEGDRHM